MKATQVTKEIEGKKVKFNGMEGRIKALLKQEGMVGIIVDCEGRTFIFSEVVDPKVKTISQKVEIKNTLADIELS